MCIKHAQQLQQLLNSLVTICHLLIFFNSHCLLWKIKYFESSFGAIYTLLLYWCRYGQFNIVITTLPWNPLLWRNNLTYKKNVWNTTAKHILHEATTLCSGEGRSGNKLVCAIDSDSKYLLIYVAPVKKCLSLPLCPLSLSFFFFFSYACHEP